MKKTIGAIIFGIVLISLASAMYPGECETIKFPNQDEVNLTIISNTSSMEGFNWSKEGYFITYCFPTYFPLGNYSFEWGNYQEDMPEPIIVHHYSSGATRTIYEDKIIEVDNYIDREVYNDTEIQRLNDDKKNLEEKLRRNEVVDMVLRILLGIILLILMVVVGNLLKKKKKNGKKRF